MHNILLVAGNFDENEGKPSKVAIDLAKGLNPSTFINGGNINTLIEMENLFNYDIIVWMANVDNKYDKFQIENIKKSNPKTILISSKRNFDEYSFAYVINHSLNIKANLTIEINKKDNKFIARVFDPLGNVFINWTEDFVILGDMLRKRALFLKEMTRVGALRKEGITTVPDNKEFFDVVRESAEIFHELIKPDESVGRFLGNASFRCQRGFPSFKGDSFIYVSRRNVDKRYIDRDNFVATHMVKGKVIYYGENKPSVDTPIQLKLYNYYKNAKYMMHSHVYVADSPYTSTIIPCGALEEVEEIIKILPDRESINFRLNLIGHGNLVVCDNLDFLKNTKYIERKIPTVMENI